MLHRIHACMFHCGCYVRCMHAHVCVIVCVRVCRCVLVRVRVCVSGRICTHAYEHAYIVTLERVRICVRVRGCADVRVCMRVCIRVCMRVCVCICADALVRSRAPGAAPVYRIRTAHIRTCGCAHVQLCGYLGYAHTRRCAMRSCSHALWCYAQVRMRRGVCVSRGRLRAGACTCVCAKCAYGRLPYAPSTVRSVRAPQAVVQGCAGVRRGATLHTKYVSYA